MKLYRNAIILVVVVALLGGAYYFANKYKKPAADNTGTAATDTIKVIDTTTDKIEKVTLVNSEGTFVIVMKGKDWVLSSPTDLNADPSQLSSVVINASSIIADKVVEENATNLAQYGLDKPVELTLKFKDGTEKTVLVGSETSTQGGYYVKMKDSGKVYVVGTYTCEKLLMKRKDMKSKTLYTLKSDDIISLSMDRKGQSVFTSQKSKDIGWNILSPIQGNANTAAIAPMLDAITQTAVNEYIEENPADLGKYGLANPVYAFDFATASAKYRLLLGNLKVNGGTERYAMLDGTKDVFTIDGTAYNFLDRPLKEIIDVFAYIVNIDQVNKIDLTMNGQTTTMTLYTYKDKDGKTDTDKDKFTVNGKAAMMKDKDDKQLFRNFYQALIGIGLDEIEVGSVPSGTPEISIKYYLNSAPGTMQVDFISKDADYYYVMRNGQYAGILVKKNKQDLGIEGMKASFKTLMDAVNAQK